MTTTTPETAAQAIDHAFRELVDRYEAVARRWRSSAEMQPLTVELDPYDISDSDQLLVDELTQLVAIGCSVRIQIRFKGAAPSNPGPELADEPERS